MTNQPTDEAAVDIVERLRYLQENGLFRGIESGNNVEYKEAADEIETLRTQLTAATRRAEQAESGKAELQRAYEHERKLRLEVIAHHEQAERMLAEVVKKLSEGHEDAFNDVPGYRIRHLSETITGTLQSIRSAASGEQG